MHAPGKGHVHGWTDEKPSCVRPAAWDGASQAKHVVVQDDWSRFFFFFFSFLVTYVYKYKSEGASRWCSQNWTARTSEEVLICQQKMRPICIE